MILEREKEEGGERERKREKERERETSISCSTYSCTHWLPLVCALTGDRTNNLGYWDEALTNYATCSGLRWKFLKDHLGRYCGENGFHVTRVETG